MKVLVACEFSGVVRDAFTQKGHDAMSCDLIPSEKEGAHYTGDVFDIITDGLSNILEQVNDKIHRNEMDGNYDHRQNESLSETITDANGNTIGKIDIYFNS